MNPYTGRVNQTLSFAQLLLEQPAGGQLQEALCQSALFQLDAGYRLHLREVAANYQCVDPEGIDSAQALCQALADMDKTPAEATEILDLATDSDSWLARLLAAFQQLSYLPEISQSVSEIPLKQLKDTSEEPDPEIILDWLQQLNELIERHRDLMYEC